jgi:hypothetical protein
MKGKDGPAEFDSVFPLQTIGTHGTEVAPGSDIVKKDLYDGCFAHGSPLYDVKNIHRYLSRSSTTFQLMFLKYAST